MGFLAYFRGFLAYFRGFYVVSNTYYKTPFGDKLILLANAHLGLDEFLWADGETIRIPFPFNESLNQYKDSIRKYNSWVIF
jgi:hypothetical protein